MIQMEIRIPNAQDWADASLAAQILGRSRATVYDMTERGVLHAHRVGRVKLWWRPELEQVSAALRRLEVKANA